MTHLEWFEARASLSHDLLANRVLNAIRAHMTLQNGLPEVPVFQLRLLLDAERELRDLLHNALSVLRPGHWLASHPGFGQLPPAIVAFLDAEFVVGSSLPAHCAEAEHQLDETMAVVKGLLARSGLVNRSDLASMHREISRLYHQISRLPRDMAAVLDTME